MKLGLLINLNVEPAEANANPAAQLANGFAKESKIGKIPCRGDSLKLAAGYSSINHAWDNTDCK
jgi:hypothetical protein